MRELLILTPVMRAHNELVSFVQVYLAMPLRPWINAPTDRSSPLRVLFVEDNADDVRLVQIALATHAPGEFAFTCVERLADALTRIKAERFDAILCDLGLPDSAGLGTVQAVIAAAPTLAVVVTTGFQDEELGREAIGLGAQDYLVKGEESGSAIARRLRHAIERKRLQNELREANETLEQRIAQRTADLESALREARDNATRYRLLTDTAMDAVVTVDEQHNIVMFNPAAERMFGHSGGVLIGQPLERLLPESIRAAHRDHVRKFHGGVSAMARNADVSGLRADGTQFPAEVSISRMTTAQGSFYTAILRDITERTRAEKALRRQKDLYEALSQTNQAIVRGVSPEDLFQTVCRIAVEHGRFRFAWIGLLEAHGRFLELVAQHGDDVQYVHEVRYSADESVPEGRGIIGHVLRTGRHDYTNDILAEARHGARHEAARRAGVRALASFPLRRGGELIGVITLYSNEPGFFTEDLLATLDDMALDVSFALDNIERDAGRKRAEQALTRQKDLYSALSQTNQTIVRGAGRDELFQSVCRIVVEHGHFLFAWIGLIEKDDPWLKPMVTYGDDSGYMAVLYAAMSDRNIPKRGLSWLAVDSGVHTVANDFLTDPETAPFHEEARRRGVRAFAAFPIRQSDEVIGVINVYAGAPGYFTDDMLATLDEMAIDVSFALDNLARDAERKKADEALRQSEGKLRAIFVGSLDGILVADAETGTFLTGNPAICRMLGYTPDEIVRLGVPDIHRQQDLPHAKEQFERLVRGEMQLAADIPVMRKDGSVFFADIKATPIRLGDKDGLLGVFRDVTERKQSERALRAAEEQFRGLVEQSIAGSYIIQDDKFVYVNPRFAEIFGYGSADEMIGLDPTSIVAEKDRGRSSENIRRRIEGEVASISYDFTGVRKDGSTIDVGVHGARATHLGRPAVIGLIQDISEKKRAEKQIRRYVSELERAFMSTVGVATTLSEMRDPYTAGHERRVAEIAIAIGAELGFDERRREGLRVAGYLHDIGKITIPSEILSKPGKLSALEFKLIQGHAQASYDILKDVEFPWSVAQIALQHHERLDGSGYPQGLKGDAILLEARIMAVADVVEAMSSHRPYRAGLGIDKALVEIERGRGTAYDPVVADACLKLFREQGYAIPA